jgi:hypothetical protein
MTTKPPERPRTRRSAADVYIDHLTPAERLELAEDCDRIIARHGQLYRVMWAVVALGFTTLIVWGLTQ